MLLNSLLSMSSTRRQSVWAVRCITVIEIRITSHFNVTQQLTFSAKATPSFLCFSSLRTLICPKSGHNQSTCLDLCVVCVCVSAIKETVWLHETTVCVYVLASPLGHACVVEHVL